MTSDICSDKSQNLINLVIVLFEALYRCKIDASGLKTVDHAYNRCRLKVKDRKRHLDGYNIRYSSSGSFTVVNLSITCPIQDQRCCTDIQIDSNTGLVEIQSHRSTGIIDHKLLHLKFDYSGKPQLTACFCREDSRMASLGYYPYYRLINLLLALIPGWSEMEFTTALNIPKPDTMGLSLMQTQLQGYWRSQLSNQGIVAIGAFTNPDLPDPHNVQLHAYYHAISLKQAGVTEHCLQVAGGILKAMIDFKWANNDFKTATDLLPLEQGIASHVSRSFYGHPWIVGFWRIYHFFCRMKYPPISHRSIRKWMEINEKLRSLLEGTM